MLRKERELEEARKKLAQIRQQQYKFLPSELREDEGWPTEQAGCELMYKWETFLSEGDVANVLSASLLSQNQWLNSTWNRLVWWENKCLCSVCICARVCVCVWSMYVCQWMALTLIWRELVLWATCDSWVKFCDKCLFALLVIVLHEYYWLLQSGIKDISNAEFLYNHWMFCICWGFSANMMSWW